MTSVFFVTSDNNIYLTYDGAKSSKKPFTTWYYERGSEDNLVVSKDDIESAYKAGMCTDKSNNQRF